jgi:hypothetical protein
VRAESQGCPTAAPRRLARGASRRPHGSRRSRPICGHQGKNKETACETCDWLDIHHSQPELKMHSPQHITPPTNADDTLQGHLRQSRADNLPPLVDRPRTCSGPHPMHPREFRVVHHVCTAEAAPPQKHQRHGPPGQDSHPDLMPRILHPGRQNPTPVATAMSASFSFDIDPPLQRWTLKQALSLLLPSNYHTVVRNPLLLQVGRRRSAEQPHAATLEHTIGSSGGGAEGPKSCRYVDSLWESRARTFISVLA